MLKEKLIDERKKKIIRMVRKGGFKKADSLLNTLRENLKDNPGSLAESFIYIAERVPEHDIKNALLKEAVNILDDYGNKLYKSGDYESAIKQSEKLLKINPNDIDSLNNYGNALSEIGKYELAIEKFEKALKINPNHIESLSNYGDALSEIGKYELAIEKFEKALKINPNDIDSLNNYGNALSIIGKYESAIEKFEKALKINPND
ncbi:MAG: tetratricopeptide repeat protein, partial [Desulfobacteraceae bacterium]|nr:tetratricopeptide repeat protein [Desulfobacteraceae bacterium]